MAVSVSTVIWSPQFVGQHLCHLLFIFPVCYLHNYLSHRQEGQGTTEELRGRDFRRELENWERSAREKRDKHRGESTGCFITLYCIYYTALFSLNVLICFFLHAGLF